MKPFLLLAALAAAVPAMAVMSAPTEAEAQVRVGRNNARSTPRPAPRPESRPSQTQAQQGGLSAEEQAELTRAEAELVQIDARIAEYQRLAETGALTDEGRARWGADMQRRATVQSTIDILVSLRDDTY